jgi:predicted RNA polymerase sigma factor
VPGVVEHLFATRTRRNLRKMVNVVPEARALRIRPFYGVLENPSAWIMRTSRNLALDVVRRLKVALWGRESM